MLAAIYRHANGRWLDSLPSVPRAFTRVVEMARLVGRISKRVSTIAAAPVILPIRPNEAVLILPLVSLSNWVAGYAVKISYPPTSNVIPRRDVWDSESVTGVTLPQ